MPCRIIYEFRERINEERTVPGIELSEMYTCVNSHKPSQGKFSPYAVLL